MLFAPLQSRALTPQSLGDAFEAFMAGTETETGSRVNASTATRVSAVWACVRLLSETISALPIDRIRGLGDERERLPATGWMEQPNEDDDWVEFVDMVLSSALLTGDGLAHVEAYNRTGDPEILRAVHPDALQRPRYDPQGRVYWLDQRGQRRYKLSSRTGEGSILHIRAFPHPSTPAGLSPIAHARESIGLSMATERFGASFFGRGSTLAGVIEYAGEWDDKIKDAIRKGWANTHAGVDNAHKPAILSGGATWKPIAVQPEDAQFLETRKFQVEEIARLYRVPMHMIQSVEKSTSWGSGIEEQGIQFVTYTLLPWIVRLERALSRLLPPGEYIKFNVSGLLRGAIKNRYEAYAKGRLGGWLSANDIRRLEDLEAIEGGDVYLQPLNTTALGEDDKDDKE